MAEPLRLPDWSAVIARHFRAEVDRATESNEHIRSKKLTPAGEKAWDTAWPNVLKSAASHADKERWLAPELLRLGYFELLSDAERVAEQHFKRFYIAAVCLQAIELGQDKVWVYRARSSREPRPDSDEKVRTAGALNPSEVLAAMRSLDGTHHHELTSLRSGLAVTLRRPPTSSLRGPT